MMGDHQSRYGGFMRWPRKDRSQSALPGVDLVRGERVLAVARTRDGSAVAASATALHLPVPGGAHVRAPWESIDHASWQDGWLRVRLTSGGEHRLRLTEPGSVPEAVQERITTTVVYSTYAKLPGAGGVRIVGRRAPDADGLTWTFAFDSGLDPEDPGLRAQAEQLLEELRRQTGL